MEKDNQAVTEPTVSKESAAESKKEDRRLRKEEKKRQKEEKKLDKQEGRRVRSMPPMSNFVPFIMKDRNDACNMFQTQLDIENAEKYIYEKRREGLKGFGLLHLIIAIYVRVLCEKPGLNRFIRGQRVFTRHNVEIMLTIKKQMKINADDTCVKFFPRKTDTAEEIYQQIQDTIGAATGEADTDFDKTAAAFAKTPRFLLRFVMRFLYFLDYYHLLPRALTKVSPFHGSMYITSMASLGIPPIYHHLYNFGNVPLFLSLGKPETVNELNADGTVTPKRTVGLNVVCDERICDGFYYASFLKSICQYLDNPYLLDVPPAQIVEDIP